MVCWFIGSGNINLYDTLAAPGNRVHCIRMGSVVLFLKLFKSFRGVLLFLQTGFTISEVGLTAIPAKGAGKGPPVTGSGLVRAGHSETVMAEVKNPVSS
jgi:hypothetical protein